MVDTPGHADFGGEVSDCSRHSFRLLVESGSRKQVLIFFL